ncbi:MAG: D-alanine--D-alanine ligase, partial [Deltaproteobacteria bacterium]
MIKLQISNFKSKKIGVLMGGMSAERDISIRSGKAVYDALIQKGYNVIQIDVGKDVYAKLTKEKIDIAFIALHGKYGEDGAIQGLLEIIGIPYTGSGIMSSAVCANKVLAKKFFILNKIPTPAFMSLGVKGLK